MEWSRDEWRRGGDQLICTMRKWDACVEWLRANLARLHPDHTRIARAALWLFVLTFIAKLAGAGREIAIAWRFGRGPEVDAYNLAIMLSLWLPLTIYSVMTVVLVPALLRVMFPFVESKFVYRGLAS